VLTFAILMVVPRHFPSVDRQTTLPDPDPDDHDAA
jgi:hypothetical protein